MRVLSPELVVAALLMPGGIVFASGINIFNDFPARRLYSGRAACYHPI